MAQKIKKMYKHNFIISIDTLQGKETVVAAHKSNLQTSFQ
jgi:hypothetical protein